MVGMKLIRILFDYFDGLIDSTFVPDLPTGGPRPLTNSIRLRFGHRLCQIPDRKIFHANGPGTRADKPECQGKKRLDIPTRAIGKNGDFHENILPGRHAILTKDKEQP
jgi:hypothetical protein